MESKISIILTLKPIDSKVQSKNGYISVHSKTGIPKKKKNRVKTENFIKTCLITK